MGFGKKIKPDDENLMPPPTTIEELWTRMNAKLDKEVSSLRQELREEGDPSLGKFVRYLRAVYATYRKTD
jgi:hypothetical protein